MTRRLFLGLVLHNHQPVGNYGFVIEQVYEQAYAPMLAALERHPGVRVAMHTSGCLFDWIEAHRPDYIGRLRGLCDRGQVEMMTGGYYEPILPMISDAAKRGQIAMLSEYIAARFAQRPTGLWLTERVWEPGLPAPLARAGVGWTLVDDAHFRTVGVSEDEPDGYYVTEDQGERVHLFAGSQRLRYAIPWADVDEVLRELRAIAASSARDAPYVLLGDDGEKFGAWPTTFAHVWEQGWIERFFSALEGAADWLETMPPGEYARRFDARGLIYLPAASYEEMMEWALPADASAAYHRTVARLEHGHDDARAFVRGGFWRSFLAKYPEANAMHKRGVRIEAKLLAGDGGAARDALWAAQCNCPYWHGVFGGLYLRHIRAATNANLVRAERLADALAAASGVTVSEGDCDFDGEGEVLVQSGDISLLIHPGVGGMVSEFDLRRRDWALLDVLARRREAYHEALLEGREEGAPTEVANIHGAVRVKEAGLAAGLIFDRYRRGGLQEWIAAPDATVEAFARGAAGMLWEPAGAWKLRAGRDDTGATVTLEREVDGWRVAKELDVPASGESVGVRYAITNTSEEPRSGSLISEWNMAPPQAPEGDDRIALLRAGGAEVALRQETGAIADLRSFVIRGSAAYGLRCELDEPCDVWHFPVDSISSSEGGLERVSQGASVSVVRAVDLAPGATLRIAFRWLVEDPAD
ncbi:MAG TPA: alpha-amylase/4-alpha-glucanotransferase domain-containing protein [Dehalococcoidia bacterium]|nr:alpha-amylase/4-alpha-glucanotransferase domain-containing protein [Dehalococcoidia bacterium]